MPEQLLTIFTVCFLALLYLFFLRVMRVMWISAAPASVVPVPTKPRKAKKAKRTTEAVVAPTPAVIPRTVTFREPAEIAGRTEALVQGLTMGRGAENAVVLNDSFLSQTHGRFEQAADGRWYLVDVGSTNGTFLNGTRIEGSVPLEVGDVIQLGNAIMDVR